MPRYSYERSLLGAFLCWIVGIALLSVGLMAIAWAVTTVLPVLVPFLIIGMLATAVGWAVHRLR